MAGAVVVVVAVGGGGSDGVVFIRDKVIRVAVVVVHAMIMMVLRKA
jgi:hypothetical protein